MKGNKLENYEIEDLEDSLSEFKKNYEIDLSQDELNTITNIQELADKIVEKFNYENVDDCTYQQAFYKLKSIFEKLNISPQKIDTKTDLKILIPRKNRIKTVKQIQKELGIKLQILEPKQSIIAILFVLSFCAIISTFFNLTYLVISGIILFFLYKITFETAREFRLSTFGELAKEITKENYFKSRRSPKTINKSEFKNIVIDWFSERLDIEKDKLQTATLI
ncbi:hypothetical protein [Chryseobacterium koreense]|uniref:Uncharacterized protein n=1 Tax=Chryseobacterium koreense CCUG 49689 TaxID=1304281 RepID=A0A0J7IV87_9FLAO|nr:hypothetical protein [Chryseobacterium koreense]KMQ70178.1 hypothetical protein ACM44_13815 [Chryseobacterium koreense CCUG 49689]MBB5334852.1 acyl carrier protein [Chryseobacterium koreense]